MIGYYNLKQEKIKTNVNNNIQNNLPADEDNPQKFVFLLIIQYCTEKIQFY